MLLNTLNCFNFDACLQFRTDQGQQNIGLTDNCTPLEETLMTEVTGNPNVMEFARLMLCASDGISILIKNMPTDDPAICRQLKDTLATLLTQASQRLSKIPAPIERQSALNQPLAQRTAFSLEERMRNE